MPREAQAFRGGRRTDACCRAVAPVLPPKAVQLAGHWDPGGGQLRVEAWLGAEHAEAMTAQKLEPPAKAPDNVPTTVPVPGTGLAKGVRVRLANLQGRTEMNGLIGTLVGMRDGRWQVRLDGGRGCKLLKERNFELADACGCGGPRPREPLAESALPGPPANGALESLAEASAEPLADAVLPAVATRAPPEEELPQRCTEYYIVGSWDALTPHLMSWDWERCCYCYTLQLSGKGWDSFQLLVDGDWERCLHPDRPHATPHIGCALRGPDNSGRCDFWTIGRHPLDRGGPGASYEVRLSLSGDSRPRHVHWVRLSPEDEVASAAPGLCLSGGAATGVAAAAAQATAAGQPAATAARLRRARSSDAQAEDSGAVSGPETRATARGPPPLRDFLQAAKPDWKDKDISVVLDKLARAEVKTTAELLSALQRTGRKSLNRMLRAADEKTFATDTLQRLREYGDSMELAATVAEPPPISTPQVPEQLFEVVHGHVEVHESPGLEAPVLGRRARGEFLRGSWETFDGFVHLAGEPGWVLRDSGAGMLLRPVGKPPLLAVHEAADGPGPQLFTVTFKPAIAMRQAPSTSAKVVGSVAHGEQVLASWQTYHGWLRLESGAWMLCAHAEVGQLVRALFLERRAAPPATPDAEPVALAASGSPEASLCTDPGRPPGHGLRSGASLPLQTSEERE